MIPWTVEVSADPDTTGEFVIGKSLINSGDDLAADERWVIIPWRQVKSVSIRRGGGEGFRPYDAGEAVVTLDNGTGDFDPDNPVGLYTMGPVKLITQGTPIRLRATGTTATTLFTGRIDEPEIGGHWAAPTATWTCSDLMTDLNKASVPDQASVKGAGDLSSTRANWLLDQALIPTSKRSIPASGRANLGHTGGGTVRDNLQRVADGEAGRFFVTRTGVVKMTWHTDEYSKPTKIQFSNSNGVGPKYESIETTPGVMGIVNAATVKRIVPRVRDEETGQWAEGDELPEAGDIDWTSVALYGKRETRVEVTLQDDTDVESLATFLANRRSRPHTRLATLVTVPLEAMTIAQAQTVLEIELGDLITLTAMTIDRRVLFFNATIENIAFDHDSPMTRVSFSTATSDTYGLYGSASWFLINESNLGSTAILAPY